MSAANVTQRTIKALDRLAHTSPRSRIAGLQHSGSLRPLFDVMRQFYDSRLGSRSSGNVFLSDTFIKLDSRVNSKWPLFWYFGILGSVERRVLGIWMVVMENCQPHLHEIRSTKRGVGRHFNYSLTRKRFLENYIVVER